MKLMTLTILVKILINKNFNKEQQILSYFFHTMDYQIDFYLSHQYQSNNILYIRSRSI